MNTDWIGQKFWKDILILGPINTPHPPYGHLLPQGEKGKRGKNLAPEDFEKNSRK